MLMAYCHLLLISSGVYLTHDKNLIGLLQVPHQEWGALHCSFIFAVSVQFAKVAEEIYQSTRPPITLLSQLRFSFIGRNTLIALLRGRKI